MYEISGTAVMLSLSGDFLHSQVDIVRSWRTVFVMFYLVHVRRTDKCTGNDI